MKKLLAIVLLLSLLLIPMAAFGGGGGQVSLTVDASQCGQVSITATYGKSSKFNLLKLYVDDVLVDTAMDQNPKPWKAQSVSYSGSMTPGSHTAYVIGHELACDMRANPVHCWWENPKTATEEFTTDACHQYSAVRRIPKNCDGWKIYASIRDFNVEIDREYIAAGLWTNPYIREVAIRGVDYAQSYEITFPDDSTVTLGMPKRIREPDRCHEFTINVIETSKCSGYYRKINLRDHGGWVKSLYVEKGPWTDPYTLEVLPGLTVPIPEEYGDDVVFDDLHEPETCLIVPGCTDPAAVNYNPDANEDDGSCYYLCSNTIKIVGDWGDYVSQGAGNGHKRQRTITFVDARDPKVICSTHIETNHACLPLFRMWLLEQFNHPDANGTLQCYVVSPTHPGVERYQRICFPCQYPDFYADRGVVGFVDSCDNWALDNERLYWRKPLAQLLAMNRRHSAGIYYPIVCEECE